MGWTPGGGDRGSRNRADTQTYTQIHALKVSQSKAQFFFTRLIAMKEVRRLHRWSSIGSAAALDLFVFEFRSGGRSEG